MSALFFFSLHMLLSEHVGRAQAPKAHSLGVFTSVIVIVCVGALVVTIQAKVSAGTCRDCNPVDSAPPFQASRRAGVRSIPLFFDFLF